ncbi:MAG TPA: proprotein convertase P-domain-containing protein [Saprospiraceae bacterium]|nr:proprotein convertase P-domain-containing protein [Saprospiraceae bacterium]
MAKNYMRLGKSISALLFLFLGTSLTGISQLTAQGCGCTNCPQFMPDNFQGDFLINVMGADNPTLGQNGQGVCGVNLHIDHEYIGDLSITLTSPSGQSVTLVGPIGFFGATDGTEWDVSFVPCNDQANPDPGFADQWNNNQNWGLGNFYSGSYYPSAGCLENFNSGPVDGTWTMTVIDGQGNDVGNFYDYEIIFCDPSGISCFSCAAEAGELDQQNVIACQGSPNLNLNLPPTYPPPFQAPPSSEYSYTYIISGAGGVILAYEQSPDLTAYDPGVYNICGLSYFTAQEGDIPPPNGSLTTTQLSNQLEGGNPPFCGDVSDDCVQVTINSAPPDEEEYAEVCAPACYSFYNINYCQSGTYIRNLTTPQGCQYTATLYLTVHQPAITNLIEVICEDECATTEGFEDRCFAGVYQEIYQTEHGCDSLVSLNLQVLVVNAVANPNGTLDCNTPTIQISGAGSSTGGTVTYLWTATNGGHIVGSNSGLNVLVDEPGDYSLRVCRAGGGAFCCDSTTITIIDNGAPPVAPASINGPATVCVGDTLTYTATPVAGANTYNWTVPAGVTILGNAQGNTIQVVWGTNQAGQVCAASVNACGTSPDRCIPVSVSQPAFGQIGHTCDSTNTFYTLTIPVGGGVAPYTVSGGNVSNGVFQSFLIPSGQPFEFLLTDTLGCVSDTLTGSFNCACATGAGQMDLSQLSACEDQTVTATHLGGQTLDGNDVTAYVLHSGSGTSLVPPVFAQNQTGTFGFQAGMVYGQTYYISLVAGNNNNGLPDPTDPCLSVAQGTPVVFYENPVANAGLDLDTCSLTQILSAAPGVGSGIWTVVQAPAPDTLAFSDNQMPNTTVTASGYGVYTLIWSLQNVGCADADTLVLDFNPTPAIQNISFACDAANENYTVSFDISNGTPGYTITGAPAGSGSGSSYQSTPIPNNGTYTYQVTDSAGCVSTVASGTFACLCSSVAGQMDNATLTTCEGGSLSATHLGGASLDGNDTSAYVLHTLPGTTLGQVLDQNTSGTFSFLPGMTYGVTYYISYVVGNQISTGPDLQDACLAVSAGQPVIFYQNPVADAGLDQSTCGTIMGLLANQPANSNGQWTVNTAPAGGSLTFSNNQAPATSVTASAAGIYELTWTLSQNGCVGTDQLTLQFNESPVLDNLTRTCDASNQNFTITLDISGGTAPYTVNGQQVVGNSFTSASFANGDSYNFTVTDVNGCTMPQINGAYSCNCATDAGTMTAQTLTVCQGQSVIATASGNATLDGNDITAYVLHNGAGPALGQVYGQNLNGQFSFVGGQMQFGVTYYISLVAGNPTGNFPDPTDPCFSVAPGQPVVWLENPSPMAGTDAAICGQTIQLNALGGIFTGGWSLVSGPGTANFQSPTDPGSNVSVSATGTYVFEWQEANGNCTAVDQVNIQFNPLPQITQLNEVCDGTNTEYVVGFTATTGLAPYTVSGLPGSFAGNVFSSSPLPNNSTYSFVLADANGCESPLISGVENCDCATNAGTMTTSPAIFCANSPASATWNNDATLDANDLVQFILHNGSSASVGSTVYGVNTQPVFNFGPGLQTGVTYYISAIAGNNSSGNVDLNDLCLSVTPGAPVQWKPMPDALISGDATICLGGNTLLSFQGTGTYPLTVNYLENNTPNNLVITGPQNVTLGVSPSATSTYTLVQVTDGTTPQCATNLTGQVTVGVNLPPEAGTPNAPLEFCPGTGTNVPLISLLTGADPGGQWQETSVLKSQGGAFNAVAGTFQPNGQTPGTYSFKYLVGGAAPCNEDEATVTIVVHPLPNADAGADKFLNCNQLTGNLGGPGTSIGQYRWILNGDTIGTDKQFLAKEGGLYTLMVISAEGCTDTDQVTVEEDSEVPVATGIVSRNIRCNGEANGSVAVTGVQSSHPPVLYSLDGSNFSSSPVFSGLSAGTYVITLQDANGCESSTDTLEVLEPPAVLVSLGDDLALQLSDSAHITLLSSVPTDQLTIEWNPLLDSTAAGKPYQNFFPLHSWQIGVTVRDSSGCVGQDRILVQVKKPYQVYIPNIFKPEGGIEPSLFIYAGSDVANIESFMIFDRWGDAIMERQNFQPNDPANGWDGTFKGQQVNPGVYVYAAVVTFIDGEKVLFKGDVTVVR